MSRNHCNGTTDSIAPAEVAAARRWRVLHTSSLKGPVRGAIGGWQLAVRSDRPVRKHPWVRLHALRDCYSMPALVAGYPEVHVTFNLTPMLLAQIDDYVLRGVTDRRLDLTLKPAGRLTAAEREDPLSAFFDAGWHHQIFVHPRYRELFDRRIRGDGVPGHPDKRAAARRIEDKALHFGISPLVGRFAFPLHVLRLAGRLQTSATSKNCTYCFMKFAGDGR